MSEQTQAHVGEVNQNNKQNYYVQLESLVARASAGDVGALRELIETIGKSVLFSTMRMVACEEDAEDISQNVLFYVCNKISALREPKAFRVWLNKIIASEAKMFIVKKSGRGIILDINDYLDNIAEDNASLLPHGYVEKKETRATIMRIVDSLPYRQRQAVVLHYFEGFTVTETADVMDIDKANVSQYLTLAREKIKAKLEEESIEINVGAVAALPIGQQIIEAFNAEAAKFIPSDPTWLESIITLM